MSVRRRLFVGRLLTSLLVFLPCLACAEMKSPSEWFDEAIQRDAQGDARVAFSLYRRAAEIGMPEAEFNVAIMLDSGRGVQADLTEAAIWYARAAAHGNPRAAYNLGQLYETGAGVPKNLAIARAWLTASGLNAARERLAATRNRELHPSVSLEMPSPVAPAPGAQPDSRVGGVEFVWTSQEQPEPVRYYLEMRALDADGSHEVFSSLVETSSVFAKVPVPGGSYAWRVMAVAQKAGKYIASDWRQFSIEVPSTDRK